MSMEDDYEAVFKAFIDECAELAGKSPEQLEKDDNEFWGLS